MFKQISPALFFFLLALPLASHADNKYFIGAGLSVGSGTHELKAVSAYASAKEEFDIDTSAANIHFGFMLKNNNRFIISAESITFEDDSGAELETSGFRLDWQFVYTDEKIKPYFGLGFGFYSSKELADLFREDFDINTSKLKGISFQLMGGIKIEANEKVEFDINLQSRAIAWQDIDVYAGSNRGTIEQITSDFTLGAGVAFKF